ncbi:MAG: C45 family peptidase [Candidatus Latescibacterota bacterium]
MDLPIIELAGSPRRMGESYGEECRAEARELYAIRLRWARHFAATHGRQLAEDEVLHTARLCLEPTQAYDPVGYEELAGIARGAGLSEEQCFVLQGLTDLRDVLAFGPQPGGLGCSSFVVAADRSATGHLLAGQNWDLQTDNMPYVRLVHRRPDGAPETWAVTVTGCLTLVGLNDAGIGVGNTNLVTRDARIGVQYLTVLHRALRARTLQEAVACVRAAPRAGAHYYYVAGAEDVAVGLECSARRCAQFRIDSGCFVHCNHAQSEEIAALEVEPPARSTRHRQERLAALLRELEAPIGVGDLQRFLSDHEGGPDRCLCRHDHEEVSTNATVILSPATGQILACRSQPHVGQWVSRRLDAGSSA